MGSEALCRNGGLSGIDIINFHFIFQFLTTPKSNIFQFSKILNNPFPWFLHIYIKIPKIIRKLCKNYSTKDSNLIESIFDWMKSWLDIYLIYNAFNQTVPLNFFSLTHKTGRICSSIRDQ